MYESEVVSVDTGEPVVTPEITEAIPQPQAQEVEAPQEEPIAEPEAAPKGEEGFVELPDGRKLPPKEAETEYRKLYSEFTRRSQELATYKKGEPITKPTGQDSEWQPSSWEEVAERAKQSLKEDMERERTTLEESVKKSEEFVYTQLEDLKKENPTLNENQLFEHAIKYQFKDLKLAHANFKSMQEQVRKASETAVQNVQKRNAEPISGSPQGGNVFEDDAYDPSIRSMSALDYLKSLK